MLIVKFIKNLHINRRRRRQSGDVRNRRRPTKNEKRSRKLPRNIQDVKVLIRTQKLKRKFKRNVDFLLRHRRLNEPTDVENPAKNPLEPPAIDITMKNRVKMTRNHPVQMRNRLENARKVIKNEKTHLKVLR